MKINIFQINHERDTNNVAFMRFSYLPTAQNTPDIDATIYDRVFSGDIHCKSLDDIYRTFNISHPADYTGRSLSVSDIVQIEDALNTEAVEPGFYYCDSIGWKRVEFDPPKPSDKSSIISALLIKPDAAPECIEMNNDLKTMQHMVDGFIEVYMPFTDDVAIICNEEGKINGLPLNRGIYDADGNLIDIIAGNFIIVTAAMDSDDFSSLSKDAIEKYRNLFAKPERFAHNADGIVVIPYDMP